MSATSKFGSVILIIAIIIGVLGYLNQYKVIYLGEFIENFLSFLSANIATELISIAITVLIIDYLVRMREEEREKRNLILQMGSPDNSFAREAVRMLRARGWLFDGSLRKADFVYSNMKGAYLINANLEGTNLWGANLEGANLWSANLEGALLLRANLEGTKLLNANLVAAIVNDDQLAKTEMLWKAIMPDGLTYYGRFNLVGDLETAEEEGIDTDNPEAMAEWYTVTPEEYQRGQEWARENLDKLPGETED
jgi:hypothetical protein